MSEEIKQEETTEEVETETVDSSGVDVKTNETEEVKTAVVDETESEEEKFIPYKRFKSVNDKMKSLQAELDALKGDTSQQTNEAETGTTEVVETEEANEETTNPLQEKVSKYEQVFNDLLNSKMKQVPEAYQDLIPDGDDIARMTWIDNAISKGLFQSKTARDFGGLGANPVSTPTITREQFMKMSHPEKAKLKQEDEDLYFQLLKK